MVILAKKVKQTFHDDDDDGGDHDNDDGGISNVNDRVDDICEMVHIKDLFVCVCVGGGGWRIIYMPISTEGSGMPTMRPKSGFPV